MPVACDICRRLDGLPLAIELAAGSLGALSLRGLADRLSRGLAGLSPGPRDAPARQRTLRATLLWSYELLDDAERAAFEATSVFAGGFTLDAAGAVANVNVDVLQRLVDKQLITAEELGGEIRFNVLQTVREFGAERLEIAPTPTAVRQRHLEHYLAFAEDVTAELRRTWSPDLIEGELENVRAALRFASRAPAPEQALRLLTAIADYLAFYSTEAIGWFDDALSLAHHDIPPKVRADALAAYAYLEQHSNWALVEMLREKVFALYEELNEAAGLARGHTVLSYVTRISRHGLRRTRTLCAPWSSPANPTTQSSSATPFRVPVSPRRRRRKARDISTRRTRYIAPGATGGPSSAVKVAWPIWRLPPATTTRPSANSQLRDSSTPGGIASSRLALPATPASSRSSQDTSIPAAHAFLQELAIVRDLPMPEYHSEALHGLAAVSASGGEDSLAAMLLGAARVGRRCTASGGDRRAARRGFFDAARDRAGGRAWQAALCQWTSYVGGAGRRSCARLDSAHPRTCS